MSINDQITKWAYKYGEPISMDICEKTKFLFPETHVSLEVKTYHRDMHPSIVLAKGLCGSAKNDKLIEGLSEYFTVHVFSPRGSGLSTGNLTLDNYISDLSLTIEYVAQKDGSLPYGCGHSMGGYAYAKLLGEKEVVKKAVLFAPLQEITEQNPKLLNWYTKASNKRI